MKYLIIGADTQLGIEFIRILKSFDKSYEGYSGITFSKKINKNEPIEACNIIVSFIGSRLSSFHLNREIIKLSEKYQNKFLLLVTSFGCGDSWPFLSEAAKKLFGEQVRIKTLSEAWLQTSSLNWKIVRPVGLTGDFIPGTLNITSDGKKVGGFINREVLATELFKLTAMSNGKERIIYIHMNQH